MEAPPRIGQTCSRCAGLMVFERFTQGTNPHQTATLWAWRCICCGDIVDRVILQNRKRA